MNRKEAQGSARLLYSASPGLSPQVRDLVLRLKAEKGGEFSTATFESAADGIRRRREAWRNPMNGLWTVEEHHRMPPRGVEPGRTAQHVLAENICFFDALYACAEFELSEPRFGAAEAEDAAPAAPHFRACAAAEGIPFDTAGLPHPAAYGRILTPGTFSDAERAVAALTRQRQPGEIPAGLRPDVASVFNVAALPAPAGAPPAQGAPATPAAAEMQQAARFRAALKAAQGLRERFGEAAYNKFSRFDYMADLNYGIGLVGGVFTAGLVPAYMIATGVSMPNRKFALAQKSFLRRAAKLPESPFREALLQYGRETALAFDMLAVRAAFRDVMHSRVSSRAYDKRVRSLAARARAEGMNEAGVAALMARVRGDIDKDDFEYEIGAMLDGRLKELGAHMTAMERHLIGTGRCLPAPAQLKLPPPKPQ